MSKNGDEKKAVERLKRLLNTNFDEKEFEIVVSYKDSVKNGRENR